MAVHEQSVGLSDEWYTPPIFFDAMAVRFNVDVAHPGLDVVSWVPADRIITHDSLTMEWDGLVWMNAPFGGRNGLIPWLNKFHEHGNGVALVPDRTSAPWWQAAARRSDLLLHVSPKPKFLDHNLRPGPSPAQGVTLMARGDGYTALVNAARAGLGILSMPVLV